jgi:exodeoxyribonuclease III
MKLVSWNVNGIRASLKKGFLSSMESISPDIMLLQETKTGGDVQIGLPDYRQYWSHAEKAGYSGTAIFSRHQPLKVTEGTGIAEHDREGRVIALEYDDFILINVYTPNSGRGLPRLGYRQEWDRVFLAYITRLEQKKPVIVGGDFNVAHQEIDLANPKENRRNAGFTDEERQGFSRYIESGFIDSFREFDTSPGKYTFWGQWNNLRQRNIGWRVDYFLVSKKLKNRLTDGFILPTIRGSDHCPVGITLS